MDHPRPDRALIAAGSAESATAGALVTDRWSARSFSGRHIRPNRLPERAIRADHRANIHRPPGFVGGDHPVVDQHPPLVVPKALRPTDIRVDRSDRPPTSTLPRLAGITGTARQNLLPRRPPRGPHERDSCD
jgi:hypothetical protein